MQGPHNGWLLEHLVVAEAGPETSIEDLVRISVGSGAARLFEHEPGVRASDAEAVHQARVATRRLRSDLKTLEPWVEPSRADRLRSELGWAGGLLGAVRDQDVLIAHLEDLGDELELGANPIAEVTGPLRTERGLRHAELVERLGQPRFLRLRRDLLDANAAPPLADGIDGTGAARSTLRKLVRGSWRRVARAIDRLDPDPGDEQLHEIRKRAKRARYAAELSAGVLDGDAEEFADRLADLQDVLGELQDAVVAHDRLTAIVTDDLSVAGAFAAGRLVGRVSEIRADARIRWREAWDAARSKRLRRWLR